MDILKPTPREAVNFKARKTLGVVGTAMAGIALVASGCGAADKTTDTNQRLYKALNGQGQLKTGEEIVRDATIGPNNKDKARQVIINRGINVRMAPYLDNLVSRVVGKVEPGTKAKGILTDQGFGTFLATDCDDLPFVPVEEPNLPNPVVCYVSNEYIIRNDLLPADQTLPNPTPKI